MTDNAPNVESKEVPAVADSDSDTAYVESYRLKFDLVRNKLYHVDEERFYYVLSQAEFLIPLLAGASALTPFLSIAPFWFTTLLQIIVTVLAFINYAIDFKEIAKYHHEKVVQCSDWISELSRQSDNLEKIVKIKTAMEKEYAKSDRSRSVQWAVEYRAWNNAYLQLTDAEHVNRKELLEILTWERALRHLTSFSQERFMNRHYDCVRRPKTRFGVGVFYICCAVVLPAAFLAYWHFHPVAIVGYWSQIDDPFKVLIVFCAVLGELRLLDLGLHRWRTYFLV
jgi:hypothetical protein